MTELRRFLALSEYYIRFIKYFLGYLLLYVSQIIEKELRMK